MGLVSPVREREASFRAGSPYTAAFLSGDDMPNAWGLFGPTMNGGFNSLQVASVLSCVRVRSEDLSTLPMILYRELADDDLEPAKDHPLYPLLRYDPNDEMTGVNWLQVMCMHVDVLGNGFAQIVSNTYGEPVSIWPLMADRMKLARDEQGKLIYRYRRENGEVRIFQSSEILHFRGLSTDGLLGCSPVQWAGGPSLLALNAERFGITFFANGSHPGGVITTNGTISTEGAKQLAADFEGPHMGVQNANRVAVLEDGTTFTPFTIPPEDAQFLETRNFERSEIAGMYRVPPHKIGDLSRSTYANIEEQNIDWGISGLRPTAVGFEREIEHKFNLRKQGLTVKVGLDALLRGNALGRAQALDIQRRNGVVNANEWRRMEGRNGRADSGGQEFWQPVNMAGTSEESSTPPGPDNLAPLGMVPNGHVRTPAGRR